MTADDHRRDLMAQLVHLLEQAADSATPVLPRIATSVAAGGYLESLTRNLVGEARDQGHSWEELAEVFGSSPLNVRNRFGTYRQYHDEG